MFFFFVFFCNLSFRKLNISLLFFFVTNKSHVIEHNISNTKSIHLAVKLFSVRRQIISQEDENILLFFVVCCYTILWPAASLTNINEISSGFQIPGFQQKKKNFLAQHSTLMEFGPHSRVVNVSRSLRKGLIHC